MSDILGRWADLNLDGEIDDFEKIRAMEMLDEEDIEEDDEEELASKLEDVGLDYDELSMMEDDLRREALEDAGLDPDDYDFC